MYPIDIGANCGECPLNGSKVIPSLKVGVGNPKLVVISETPLKTEENEGRYLCTESGRLTQKVLEDNGVESYFYTCGLLCRPSKPLAAKELKQAFNCCRPRLQKEIEESGFSGKYILTLGQRAQHITIDRAKLADWMGAPLPGEIFTSRGTKKGEKKRVTISSDLSKWEFLSTFHPGKIRSNLELLPVFRIHVARTIGFNSGQIQKWVWPKCILEPGEEMKQALRDILSNPGWIGFDVETAGKQAKSDKLLCVGIATENLMISVPWMQRGSMPDSDEETKELVKQISASREHKRVMQNGIFDVVSCDTHGIITYNDFDLMHAQSIVAPLVPRGLAFIGHVETHSPRWKSEFKVTTDESHDRFSNSDPYECGLYNAKDAWMQLILKKPLLNRLQNHPNGMMLFEKRMSLIEVSIKMKLRGIRVDMKKLEEFKVKASAEIEENGKQITEVVGKLAAKVEDEKIKEVLSDYNPKSTKDMKVLFVDALGVRPRKLSQKTQAPSFDEEVMTEFITLPNKTVSILARAHLKYRQGLKTLKTYIDGLPILGDRVYPNWTPGKAKTGRWACSDPNLMNIPQWLRSLYIGDYDEYYIVAADYSQLELRILALLSGDKKLLQWYADGVDVHYENAKLLLKVREPTKAHRDLAKGFVYGTNYGGGEETLWKTLVLSFPSLSLSDVSKMMFHWRIEHKEVSEYQREIIRFAKKNGYIISPLSGRHHYFAGGKVEPTKVKNFPMQDGAAEICDRGVLNIAKEINWVDETIKCQVHDEITLCGPKSKVMKLAGLQNKYMRQEIEYKGNKMMFDIDWKIGLNWNEKLKKYKNIQEIEKEFSRYAA